MNALITGGCGFVGSNLAAYLVDLDPSNKVTVFDNLSRHGASANLSWLQTLAQAEHNPITFLHGDIRNAFDVETAIKQLMPDVIFHLAGQVAMTTSMQSPRRDFEINVLGSINVLEAVRQYTPKTAIIYASSNKVYGNLGHLDLIEAATRWEPRTNKLGVDEDTAIEFHTPYGCSKGAADQYMLDYARGLWAEHSGVPALDDLWRATVCDVRSGLGWLVLPAGAGGEAEPESGCVYGFRRWQAGAGFAARIGCSALLRGGV